MTISLPSFINQKTNTAAPKWVLLLASKNPGRGHSSVEEYKKAKQTQKIIIMILVASNVLGFFCFFGFFQQILWCFCYSSSTRIMKTLCTRSPSGTHNQGGVICQHCFHSASRFWSNCCLLKWSLWIFVQGIHNSRRAEGPKLKIITMYFSLLFIILYQV